MYFATCGMSQGQFYCCINPSHAWTLTEDAGRLDLPPAVNRLDGTLSAIEASLSLPQEKTPREQHVLFDDRTTLAMGPATGMVVDRMVLPRVVGPDQGTGAANRRTSRGNTDQSSRSRQRSKVTGAKDLVRLSTGTDQGRDHLVRQLNFWNPLQR
jgi:hypothetical protein